MFNFNRSTDRWLCIEQLEERDLLSGNVVASVIGDSLWINGDSNANDLSIEASGSQVVLIGNSNTQINGRPDPFAISEAGLSRVFIFLGEGDDRIVFEQDLQLDGNVTIRTGRGNDIIGFDQTELSGRLRITSGSGSDQITIRNSVVEGLRIATGADDDVVGINGLSSNGWASIRTGRGSDDASISNSSFRNGLAVVSGSGDDTLAVGSATSARLFVGATGSGDDFVHLEGVSFNISGLVLTGQGNDVIDDDSSSTEPLFLFGGSGADQLESDGVSNAKLVFSFTDQEINSELKSQRLSGEDGLTRKVQLAQVAAFGEENPETQTLVLDLSSNSPQQSNGTLIVDSSELSISGTSLAESRIEIDSDGDGSFDDGITTADESGAFSIVANLTNDTSNNGQNIVQVRAVSVAGLEATETISVHYAVGTVVRFETDLGRFDVELLDEDAPQTVENFLSYLDDYQGSIVHRSPGAGFVQGGSFTVDGGTINAVPTNAPISNEFDSANSNLRGTLSMALLSNGQTTDPQSGTSGWFINTTNNSNLDADLHTVFGRVIGEGLEVLDAIDALPDVDVSARTVSAFQSLPVEDYTPFSNLVSGTISLAVGSDVVTGLGTAFLTDVVPLEVIEIGGQVFQVRSIESDTRLTVDRPLDSTSPIVDASGRTNVVPETANYVFLDVEELFDSQG
ncbi:MAG: peptidylprolyl isomerase [Planctomycetota bacterium]